MIAAACVDSGASFGFVFGALVVGALMLAVGYAVGRFKSVSDQVGPFPDDQHLCRSGQPIPGSWIGCPTCGPSSWGDR